MRTTRHPPGNGLLEVELGVGDVPLAGLMAVQEALGTQHGILHTTSFLNVIKLPLSPRQMQWIRNKYPCFTLIMEEVKII